MCLPDLYVLLTGDLCVRIRPRHFFTDREYSISFLFDSYGCLMFPVLRFVLHFHPFLASALASFPCSPVPAPVLLIVACRIDVERSWQE